MTDADPSESSADGRRSRATLRRRPGRWFLLDADRLAVTSFLVVAVFVACFALAVRGIVPTDDPEPVRNFLGSLLGGLLPFVTVVLAINQLILSTEFGTTGTFRNRLDETETFRQRVEEEAGLAYSPARPAEFLRVVLRSVGERARRLEARREDVTDGDAREALRAYATRVFDAADGASRRLDGATFGTFEIVSVIVDYDDPAQLHEARRLRAEYGEALPPDVVDTLDELTDLLEDVHVARQYFKTVHTQQELAALSRLLLYVGFLTLIGDGFVILAGDALYAALDRTATMVAVSAAVALVFAPFAVLFAYVFRIATIARLTAADFRPFLLRRNLPDDGAP